MTFILPKTCAPSKWDRRFLELAMLAATWPKKGEVEIGEGCAICDEFQRTVTVTCNGLPRGLETQNVDAITILDAATNALVLSDRNLRNCTLFTFPVPASVNNVSTALQKGCRRFVTIISDHIELQKIGVERAETIKEICKEINAEFLIYWPSDLIDFPQNMYDIQTLWYQRWMNRTDKIQLEHKLYRTSD